MPLPKRKEIKSIEGWNNFTTMFKNENKDHQKFERYYNAANKLTYEGNFLEAKNNFDKAEKYQKKAQATFEKYEGTFQRRLKKYYGDKGKTVNVQMQKLKADLQEEKENVTILKEIAVSGVVAQKSREQSPAEVNFPGLSGESLEQALDNLSQRDPHIVLNYRAGEVELLNRNYDKAIYFFETALQQIKENESNVDHPLVQHIESMKQEAQQLLDNSQQLPSELSSSNSEGASPASAGSERSSPVDSPRIPAEQAADTYFPNPLFQGAEMTSSMPVISTINTNVSNERAALAIQQPDLLTTDEQRAVQHLRDEGNESAVYDFHEGNSSLQFGNYSGAISLFESVLDKIDRTSKTNFPLVKNIENKIAAAQQLLDPSRQVQSQPLSSGSESSSLTSSEVKAGPTPVSDRSAADWKKEFDSVLKSKDYLNALSLIEKGNNSLQANDSSSAIGHYRYAYLALQAIVDSLSRPVPLQSFSPMERLEINAQKAEVLSQVRFNIKSVENQLKEAQRPRLPEEELGQQVEQIAAERKTILSADDQARLIAEMTGNTAGVARAASTKVEASTTSSTAALSSSIPFATPSVPGVSPPLTPSSDTLSSSQGNVGTTTSPSTQTSVPPPVRHSGGFFHSLDVALAPKNLPTSVLGLGLVTGDLASERHTDERHSEDDLSRLLEQVDQGQTASHTTSAATHVASSEEQMLREMGGNDPAQIESVSLQSRINSFYRDDDDYKGYLECERQAMNHYTNDNFELAIETMEKAQQHLTDCKITLVGYAEELHHQLDKTPSLQQSTLPSTLHHLQSNIDSQIQRSISFKKLVGEELAEKQTDKQREKDVSRSNELQPFEGKDSDKGSSGPTRGSGSGPTT